MVGLFEANRALVDAHFFKALISSFIVVDKGTILLTACNKCLFSNFGVSGFSIYAANIASFTASSISAPLCPSESLSISSNEK